MAGKKERWEYELDEMLRASGISAEEPGGTQDANSATLEISANTETVGDVLDYLQAAISSAMENCAERKEFSLGDNLLEAISMNRHILIQICMRTGFGITCEMLKKKLTVWKA